MLSNSMINLATIGMAMICAGGVAYVFLYPLLSGERTRNKRLNAVKTPTARLTEQSDQRSRSKKVQDSLKELQDKSKKPGKDRPTLAQRLSNAGLKTSPKVFLIISISVALFLGLVAFTATSNLLIVGAVVTVVGFGLPRWVLNFLTKRRQSKFILELPNAIDIIVRGVKAGLPLNDCLRMIAAESQEPVRSEFREVIESQAIGVQAAEALERMYTRIPLPEVNFFAITVSIQQNSGGNLSEALTNLSKVLRERKRMAAKIQAMSQEAKASAAIIGSLPVIVMALVYMTSPDYIALLWTERLGHIMLAGSGVWMFTGIMAMRKMINFKF